MRKKILIIIVLMLMISVLLAVPLHAGDQNDPELVDRKWDVKLFGIFGPIPQKTFSHIDIISVWFSENEEQPDLLTVSMKLRDLNNELVDFDAGYTIGWSFSNTHYLVVAHTLPEGEETFTVGSSTATSNEYDWKTCSGVFEREENILTFTVTKDSIGDPPPFSSLDNIHATTFLRKIYEDLGRPSADFFKDLTHNAKITNEYRIKY